MGKAYVIHLHFNHGSVFVEVTWMDLRLKISWLYWSYFSFSACQSQAKMHIIIGAFQQLHGV